MQGVRLALCEICCDVLLLLRPDSTKRSITEMAYCPPARTELPFFRRSKGEFLMVNVAVVRRLFIRLFSKSPLAALITGPGAAL